MPALAGMTYRVRSRDSGSDTLASRQSPCLVLGVPAGQGRRAALGRQAQPGQSCSAHQGRFPNHSWAAPLPHWCS